MSAEATALVVGLGNPDRGDDAVGVLVAREVAALGLPGAEVVEQEDPTALVDLWAGRPVAVVVDAVRSGGPPGGLVVLETGDERLPLLDPAFAATAGGGTHALGLAGAVELARALGTLPDRLVVVGVEALRFDPGAPVSAPVGAAVARARDAVLASLPTMGEMAARARVEVRRVYDPPEPSDGARVLVDRVWPRGLSKEQAGLDEWCKEVAPSTELRKWYGHDPERFDEFRDRYLAELREPGQAPALTHLRELVGDGKVTLLTATKDVERSQAAVLAELLAG